MVHRLMLTLLLCLLPQVSVGADSLFSPARLQQAKQSIIPVGVILMWPAAQDPPAEAEKWLECTGQRFDINKYPLLYQRLQQDTVPDYRGQFLKAVGSYGANYARNQQKHPQWSATNPVYFTADVSGNDVWDPRLELDANTEGDSTLAAHSHLLPGGSLTVLGPNAQSIRVPVTLQTQAATLHDVHAVQDGTYFLASSTLASEDSPQQCPHAIRQSTDFSLGIGSKQAQLCLNNEYNCQSFYNEGTILSDRSQAQQAFQQALNLRIQAYRDAGYDVLYALLWGSAQDLSTEAVELEASYFFSPSIVASSQLWSGGSSTRIVYDSVRSDYDNAFTQPLLNIGARRNVFHFYQEQTLADGSQQITRVRANPIGQYTLLAEAGLCGEQAQFYHLYYFVTPHESVVKTIPKTLADGRQVHFASKEITVLTPHGDELLLTDVVGGTENRPRNTAIRYFIRALPKNTPFISGATQWHRQVNAFLVVKSKTGESFDAQTKKSPILVAKSAKCSCSKHATSSRPKTGIFPTALRICHKRTHAHLAVVAKR